MAVHSVHSEADLQKLQATGQLVVTDWFATWCGPCVGFKPIFQKMAEEYKPNILFCKIDVDECKELASKHGISSMPTFKVSQNYTSPLKIHANTCKMRHHCSSLSVAMKSDPSVERTKVPSDA